MGEYSKAKVTIDYEEYQDLLSLKNQLSEDEKLKQMQMLRTIVVGTFINMNDSDKDKCLDFILRLGEQFGYRITFQVVSDMPEINIHPIKEE